jgi:hypothetical protein
MIWRNVLEKHICDYHGFSLPTYLKNWARALSLSYFLLYVLSGIEIGTQPCTASELVMRWVAVTSIRWCSTAIISVIGMIGMIGMIGIVSIISTLRLCFNTKFQLPFSESSNDEGWPFQLSGSLSCPWLVHWMLLALHVSHTMVCVIHIQWA